MLFDLRGRRKNLIRVVYAFLAVLFAVAALGTGIGVVSGGGGFFDLLGGGGSNNSILQDEVKKAQQQVQANPKSAAALLALANAEFNLSKSAEGIDTDTGYYNDKGQQAAAGGVEAWEKYLKTDPKKPNPNTALLAATTYQFLGDAEGALKAQRIVVKTRPTAPVGWENLALYAYATGNNALGDKAQKKTLALVPKDQRNTVEAQLKKEEKAGKSFYKKLKQAEKQQKKSSSGGQTQDQGSNFGPLPGQGGGLSSPGASLGQ